MRIGTVLPVEGDCATRDYLARFAVEAEQLGFDSLWSTDRLLYPALPPLGYPYAQERAAVAFDRGRQWLEPLITLAFAAAVTQHVRLGTNVLVLPYRQPVVLAQETATLDRLAEGRLVLGVGTGWMTEEFAAVGVPRTERGARTDEYIDLLRSLWSSREPVLFEGQFLSIDGMTLASSPSREAGPTLLVGGNSDAALRRVVRRGDGWLGVDLDEEETARAVTRLRELCDEADRDFFGLEVSMRRRLEPSGGLGEQNVLGISTAHLVDQLGSYAELGVGVMIFDLLMLPDMSAGLQALAGDVMSQL